MLLTIDPATKLLSSIDLKVTPEMLRDRNVTVEKIGWSPGAVSTELRSDRSFAFEAPKGFAKVDTLLRGADDGHPKDAKVGKPAPDFTLTLLDGPGKTRTITKAELAGKVVVIDFWATWCGPCLKELPEIQKLIDSYANTKKDVMIVALSQDDEPSDLRAGPQARREDAGRQQAQIDREPGGTDRPRPEQIRRVRRSRSMDTPRSSSLTAKGWFNPHTLASIPDQRSH